MTRIKICGITRYEDAALAADLGADFLGFIFVPESPRFIEPERAAEIMERVRGPKTVGVFRDNYVPGLPLDYVQLHGTESDDDARAVGTPVIKALRVTDTLPDTNYPSAEWLLFDTGGGTGRTFDWALLTHYSRAKPFLLAGGITPDNVAAAIEAAHPDAIDLASGVESSPGIKDHQKLRQLFEKVRNP